MGRKGEMRKESWSPKMGQGAAMEESESVMRQDKEWAEKRTTEIERERERSSL